MSEVRWKRRMEALLLGAKEVRLVFAGMNHVDKVVVLMNGMI